MFEALAGVIRLQRMKRNLTVRQLATKAGVNHLQLELLEDGHPVGIELLTKIARALDLTDLPAGELCPEREPAEVTTIARAVTVLRRLEETFPGVEIAAGEVRDASAALDEIIWPVRERASSAQPGLAAVLPFTRERRGGW